MLSARGFWRGFSARQFHLAAVEGLPETLSYAALFDQLFGKLTRHRIAALEPQQIRIDCLHCDYAREALVNDVCETHIGILQGQFERRFNQAFRTERLVAEGICRLRMFPGPSDYEET